MKIIQNIKNMYKFLKLIHKASPSYILGVIFSHFLSAIITIGELYISKLVLNKLAKNNVTMHSILLYYAIYIILHYIILQLQIVLNNMFNSIKSIKISSYLKESLFHKVKELDLSFYESTEFYNDFYRAIDEIEGRAIDVVDTVATYIEFVFLLFFTGALFFDPIFIIAALAIVVKHIPYLNKLNYNNYQLSIETSLNDRKLGYISHIFSSQNYVKELKIYKAADLFIKQNETYMDYDLKLSKKHHYLSLKHSILASFLSHAIHFLLIIYIGYKAINHMILAGDFIFFIQSFSLFSNTLVLLFQIYPDLKKHSLYIDNINKLLCYKSNIKENEMGVVPSKEKGELDMKNVTFSYPNSQGHMVLEDISFNIQEGAKLAIVGYNGAGKSTLIRLILQLYHLDKGNIFYNKVPYKNYNLKSLQDRFGILFQDFVIYPFSIGENILMREVKGEEDEKLVVEALQFSGLWDKVEKLEKGIHTVISKEFDEEGIYMSGGEYQKLAMARAYGRDCSILIFDEPSSALDTISEYDMFQKILQLGKEKTVIYISHRLSSTVNADKIILLDEGRISEVGTHDKLMKQKGTYFKMFQIQAEKYQIEEVEEYE